jgi:hypothetical protein
VLEKKCQEYEKERKFVIDSTIRKSFALSSSVAKHRGDAEMVEICSECGVNKGEMDRYLMKME